MPILFAKLREKLPARFQWKDVVIAAMAVMLVGVSAYAFRDSLALARAKLQAGAAGGETVSVFDVEVDRENRQYVDILFDRPLGEGLQGQVLDAAPATLYPELSGAWKWQDTNALRFQPNGAFPVASTYTITLIPERILRPGQVFTGDTKLEVVTDRFLVEGVDVDEEPAIVGKGQVVFRGAMRFNYPVSPEVLATKVKLIDPALGEDKPIAVELEASWTTTVHNFRTGAVQKQPDERKVRLVIAKDLAPAAGNVPLGEDYTREIEVGSSVKLAVREVSSLPGAKESTISIRFSSPVAEAVAAKYLHFTPAVPFQPASAGNTLTVSGPFRPGQSYKMTIGKGLPATDDSSLQEEYTTTVRLPDLEASVDFQSQGMFLSAAGNHTVAIETVNLKRFDLAIDRVYRNNLFFLFQYGGFFQDEFAYGGSEISHALGDRLQQETIEVKGPRNQPVQVPITLDRHVPAGEKGLFRVVVTKPDDYEGRQRWILLTDLGAVAKQGPGEFLVWVSSFKDLGAVAGAKVTLLSDQNQPLGSGTTNGEGIWRLSDAKALAGKTPYLVTIEKGDDFSFLLLEDMRIDPADLDVGGAEPPGEGYTAFLYGERDIYRPGETLEGLAVVRDGALQAPPAMPALLRWRDPQGRERGVQKVAIDERGLVPLKWDIPAYALTGRHSLELEVAEKIIGQYGFQVEEFVPDRIKVEIAAPKEGVGPGEELAYNVAGTYLFGPPAAGLAVESRVRLVDSDFSPKGFESFRFRNGERTLEDREVLFEEGTLDDEGKKEFRAQMPAGTPVPSSLEAVVTARVQEQGGRGVAALQRMRVHPYPYYLGLRRPGEEGYAEPGKPVAFEWVAVSPQGKETAAGALRADLYLDRWNTVLRRTPSGSFRYESTRDPVLLGTQSLPGGKARGTFRFTPRQFGSYRAVLTDPETQASTEVEFYAAGWGYSPWALKNPARLELDLDKEEYAPGDTATVQVRAPFPGKLLLTVERDRVLRTSVHELTGNTAKIPIPVDGDWRPNAYVTATLVRRAADLEPGSAGRAFGAVPISVDRTANRLAPEITVPAEVRPESRVEVAVQTKPGAVVTVAAVDEGILQLIAQKTAQPFDFFYRKLALGVTSYDSFSLLLPEVKPEGAAAAGGGEGADGLSQYVRTEGIRRVQPVAFWSGPVTADAAGKVRVAFRVPEFQGALRVMAVAVAGRQFGSAEKMMRVRTPVVVLPTFPRVLSFQETLQVPVTVRNDTGRPGRFAVSLAAQGPVRVEAPNQTVEIGNGKETTVYFAVKTGDAPGDARFVATAQGNGQTTRSTAAVPVRADLPPVTIERAGAVEDDSLRLKLEGAGGTAGDFRPDTVVRQLRIGPVPLVQFAGKLSDLLHYPYGCVEQTVSTSFPLVYMADLAKQLEPDLFDPKKGRGDPAEMVQEGLRRLATMQVFGGGFAMWPGGQAVHPWGSVYAAHFLVEARKAGHPVEDFLYDGALGWVAGDAKAKSAYGQEELQRTVYDLYVLARAGRADLGTMDFLREKQAKNLRTESRAMLAAAYAAVGNPQALGDLLAGLGEVEQVERQTGGNFNSTIRNRALLLLALLDAQPKSPRIPALLDRLARDSREAGGWNTQEGGFTFIALGQFYRRQAQQPPYSGTVWLGDKKVGTFGNQIATFPNLRGTEPVRIEMAKGYRDGAAFFSLMTRGIPTDDAFRPANAGLEIEREMLTRDGQAADLANVRQGDLLVVKTRVRSVSGPILNAVVVNLLPSGLEIENPRLETTEQLPWVTDANLSPDNLDLRDDRILVFTDLPANTWQTFYSLARAVAPGKFRLPPVQAEAMYNPAIRATGQRGEIEVKVRE